MSKKSQLKKNLGYQTFYQVLNTCLPLITAPYLARTLGADQQGVYSYMASIVAYFALFAKLGTANYGTRSIAACGEDKARRSQTFFEIYVIELILASAALGFYLIYCLFICKGNRIIANIQCFELIACMFDISWLFFGLEKFKTTTIQSMIIRIINVAAILLFVKNPDDLWIYTLIMTISNVVNMLVLWRYVPQYIVITKIKWESIKKRFLPNFMLFLPLLAMSIYHIMDKTMLGWLSSFTESGYYYNADKIINIPVGLLGGISTVMLPRMSALIGNNKLVESDQLFKNSLELTVAIGSAIAFGIGAIAKEFEPIFFGPGFEKCIILTIALAPVLIVKSFSFTARYQYLIPHHLENAYTISVVIGAVTNLVANTVMIPSLGALGAVLGTLLAEVIACVWQFITLKKYIQLGQTLLHCFIYVCFGVIMFILVRGIAMVNIAEFPKILIEIVIGAISFIAMCIIYWRLTDGTVFKAISQIQKNN